MAQPTDEHLTWVAPNIFQRPSGHWVAIMTQNGQRIAKGYSPETPRAEVERYVQQVKDGRRPRPVKERRWPDLEKVDPNIPNIFRRWSGRLVAKVYQNGRPLQQGFPPGAFEAAVRWVQAKKAGRKPRPTVAESRWQRQTKLAPHIWRLPRGRLWAQVSQNGRRFQQSFEPGALEAAARWVQEKKAGRRPRLANGSRHYPQEKVRPNIFRTRSGGGTRESARTVSGSTNPSRRGLRSRSSSATFRR